MNETKINICHINSNFDKFYTDFMNEQIKQGLNIEVFYFRDKNRGLPDIKENYLNVRLNYSTWQRYFFYLKEKIVYKDFVNQYDIKKFNLLHAHTLFSNGYIAYKANVDFGVPYIVAVRSMDLNIFFKYRVHLRSIGIKILENAEQIIFISENLKNELLKKYIPKKSVNKIREKSKVVPNGINNFYLENIQKPKIYNKSSNINLISVGHIYNRKNQLMVCKAVELLIEKGYKINYLIIGKVLDYKYYKRIMKYSFVKHIPFIDKEELINYYNSSTIFIMPSKIETFGLTYVEAMTQGLPVIYSKGQGFQSYFKDSVVGFSVDSEDYYDIAEKIIRIVNTDYTRLSENSIYNSKQFNWKKINKKYIDIYSNIVEREKKIEE